MRTEEQGRSTALVLFFLLAYILSWLIHVPLALAHQGVIKTHLPAWLHFVGAFGPMAAALLVTAWQSGPTGLRELLGRVTRWRVGTGWLLVGVFSPALAFLAAAPIFRLVSGQWPFAQFGALGELPELNWLAGWLVWTLTFGLGEETGWRGFALPRLQASRSARSATLIVGLLWAGWHLPQFFYNYKDVTLFGLAAFLVSILSGALVLTFLYNSTGGSVLVAILWHGSLNTAVAEVDGLMAALVNGCIILAAVLIANRYGPDTLSATGNKHIL
jgi:membrane protease YdiL (CAAX protease family)